ncbi:MAG: PilW family protein [Woeseiaceae bacterium]|nr:PilW family protein [Woeseiaceae bacterium]
MHKKQRGLTLIEIMIALLLGLIITAGMIQVFSSTRQSNRVHDAIARMQETGRMALEVVARDVRMADFWGCAADIANVTNNLNTAGTGFIDFGTGGILGTDGGGLVPDTLVLRSGINRGILIQPPFGPATSADVTLPTSNGLSQGDIVLISDCENADIFQITNADPDSTGLIGHDTSNAVEPGNVNITDPGCAGANAHCLSKVYAADANVFGTQEVSYAIATGSEGEPALFRNGLEFLDGVENLQILYGEDTDGDFVANYYVPANQVVDMLQVISIRFAVVVRSAADRLTDGANQTYAVLGTNVTAGDTRLRQVYTSTVTVRNRL